MCRGAGILCLNLALLISVTLLPPASHAQVVRIGPGGVVEGVPGSAPSSSSPSVPSSSSPNQGSGPWIPSEPLASGGGANETNEIQLSFQGANIDMVIQWLSQTTGKSVVKHPQAHCQLTITSSKKLSQREAINLVYRALALEGFSAIEFNNSILIVPEGKEPRMSPELLGDSGGNVPEGRQRLVKVFPLKFIRAADLRARIGPALSDKAVIDVDERANQIIITDYNDNIRAAGDLISALDNERPEDVAVRAIQLKHVLASNLMKEVAPLYQKKNSTLKDTVDLSANELSNSLLVLSSEANFRAIEKFVSELDTEEAQEKIMRTFTLKNADAQDVAKQLQDLNQDQGVSSRYVYYYTSPSPQNTRKMTVVADRRRNAVIVQAPPAQMDGIEKMIAELDEPINDGSLAPRIYTLKYVSAVDIEDVLTELFLKRQQQRDYWDSYYSYYYGSGDTSSSDGDVGRLFGKVRITSEPYSNTIIVTSNSKESLKVVEDVLKQLDVPSEAGESTLRIGLRFAKAATVANSINILFAKNGSPPMRQTAQPNQQPNQGFQQQQQQGLPSRSGFDLESESKEEGYYPWLGGQPDNIRGTDGRNTVRPASDLVGRVRAVADPRSNALLVSANVHFFPQVLKLLADLDAPTDQVLIEARLVEVSSNFLDKLGVRWSPDGTKVFTADDYDNSLLASARARYQRGFGGNTTVNTPSDSTMAQALTSLRSGVLESTIDMDFLIQFLRKTTDATVLAEPQINIKDNETGRLFVGQQVPIPQNTQVSQLGGLTTSISYKDVGVVLEVTPHINITGDVELRIHAESSTVVPGQTVLGGAVFDTRNFRTDLTAHNGETLIVGGIIQKQVSDTLRKTPVLGSIPGLGWAFKKRDKTTQQVELMVFLRPKVVRNEDDAAELLKQIGEKAPLMKKWMDENDTAKAEQEK